MVGVGWVLGLALRASVGCLPTGIRRRAGGKLAVLAERSASFRSPEEYRLPAAVYPAGNPPACDLGPRSVMAGRVAPDIPLAHRWTLPACTPGTLSPLRR